MNAGKYAGFEVGCADSLDECYRLVEAYERTKVPCMMLENAAYERRKMMLWNMHTQGLFGEIVYCTCSICKDEGERQIEKFLSKYQNFSISPIKHCSNMPKDIFTPEGFIRTLPHHLADGCDSFFVAKLVKEK